MDLLIGPDLTNVSNRVADRFPHFSSCSNPNKVPSKAPTKRPAMVLDKTQ